MFNKIQYVIDILIIIYKSIDLERWQIALDIILVAEKELNELKDQIKKKLDK